MRLACTTHTQDSLANLLRLYSGLYSDKGV